MNIKNACYNDRVYCYHHSHFIPKEATQLYYPSQLRMDHDILDGELGNMNCQEKEKCTHTDTKKKKTHTHTHTQKNMKQIVKKVPLHPDVEKNSGSEKLSNPHPFQKQ